jgi:carboxyl-terminal processing protease
LLDAAIGILNKFVEKGNLLLTTKGRLLDSERKYFSNETPMISPDIPLVVLINENTASASEILAGAVQDLDRGVIIGTKSFGKGLVQVYSPLSFGNQLKITNQKYYTPSGRWIQTKNYFKDNKYGVFKSNPYFDQKEFKTIGGRRVFAEGGITPDTIVDVVKNNELLEALYTNDMYYKFAADYVYSNPDGNSFSMNDEIVNQFYSYLMSTGFEFHTKAETELTHLKKEVTEKQYSVIVAEYIGMLESELASERLKDFDKSRGEIKRQLAIEILKKYNKPENTIAESGINDDVQLQAALSIIRDRTMYNGFLSIR